MGLQDSVSISCATAQKRYNSNRCDTFGGRRAKPARAFGTKSVRASHGLHGNGARASAECPSGAAKAQTPAPAAAPEHTLTANVGIFSQYIFRGISQTAGNPALQGGFDYAHSSGFYAGTWASNVSWLEDFELYTRSSLEWDFYGGYKANFGDSDFLYDLGTIYYYCSLLAELSGESLNWMQRELEENADCPAIVFYHAPLKGTLMSGNRGAETADFVAQPYWKISEIIAAHPQIFRWVSGHMHIAPTNARFNDPVNLFRNQVTAIHICDMDGRSYLAESDPETTKHHAVWTNSLYLYRDLVLVKTYDHEKGQWMEGLEKRIKTVRR